jgi:phosphatidate cytidylyltransferase
MSAPSKASTKITDNQLFRRVAVIAVLAPLTLWVMWTGGRVFSAVIAFCSVILIFEWTRIVNRAEFRAGFYLLSVTAVVSIFAASSGYYFIAYLFALLGGAVGVLVEWVLNRRGKWPLIAAFYIIAPCVALIWIRNIPELGRDYIFLLFLTVWATDSGAYVVGKIIGGPKMIPSISPNKTWAGTLGGIFVAMVSCILIGLLFMGRTDLAGLALVGISLSVATVVGDIAESALKRQFGVKDSGGYIPGHGGLLDRLDGFLFATVMMAIVLYARSFI